MGALAAFGRGLRPGSHHASGCGGQLGAGPGASVRSSWSEAWPCLHRPARLDVHLQAAGAEHGLVDELAPVGECEDEGGHLGSTKV